jgi:hypothetical protein
MRFNLILCLLLCGSFYAACQGNENGNVHMSQEEYQATLVSDKHVHIQGTNLFIVPPDSFKLANKFLGFVHPSDGASIVIRKLPSYENALASFTSPEILDQKMKNGKWKSEKLKIKGRNAVFLSTGNSGSGGPGMAEWILLCQNDEGCYLLEGRYPSALEKEYSSKIKDCILSIIIR